MTNHSHDPYADFDVPPRSSGQQPPSPQPVTGPQNPFLGSRPAPSSEMPHQNPFLPPAHSPIAPRPMPVSPQTQPYETNLRLNAWLSVLVPIAPIVFFFVDKGKQPLYDDHLREQLNMGLTRVLLTMGASLFSGWIAGVLGLVSVAYVVLAVLGALEAPKRYVAGAKYQYPGAIPFTRQ